MRALAVFLLFLPATTMAQAVTSTPLPPPPGISAGPATPLPAKRPVARAATPSALGVPVVRSSGPAAKKPHKPKLKAATTGTSAKPPTHAVARPIKPASPVAAPAAAPVATAPPPPKQDPTKGSTTGLPLPRWAALRSDQVNLRVGPGMDRPVDWQYHRRDLPVRIEREYEIWRLVEDQDGTKGWVNSAVLTGRRGFVVTGAERVLRASAADTADPVAKLEVGVVGLIRGCAAGNAWCEVKTGDYRGWLKRTDFYGVDADEAVGS